MEAFRIWSCWLEDVSKEENFERKRKVWTKTKRCSCFLLHWEEPLSSCCCCCLCDFLLRNQSLNGWALTLKRNETSFQLVSLSLFSFLLFCFSASLATATLFARIASCVAEEDSLSLKFLSLSVSLSSVAVSQPERPSYCDVVAPFATISASARASLLLPLLVLSSFFLLSGRISSSRVHFSVSHFMKRL